VLQHVSKKAAHEFARKVVSNKVSLLATDSWPGYKKLSKTYPHVVVDHSIGGIRDWRRAHEHD
jgi:hypothetical protein